MVKGRLWIWSREKQEAKSLKAVTGGKITSKFTKTFTRWGKIESPEKSHNLLFPLSFYSLIH